MQVFDEIMIERQGPKFCLSFKDIWVKVGSNEVMRQDEGVKVSQRSESPVSHGLDLIVCHGKNLEGLQTGK